MSLSSECLEWTGNTGSTGYGQLQVAGRKRSAHRVAWETANGPIPPGMFVCHRCDNPRCVLVDHLFLGTPADNVRDMMEKGRHVPGTIGGRGAANGHAKLSAADVASIKNARLNGATVKGLRLRFAVSDNTIRRVLNGATWSH